MEKQDKKYFENKRKQLDEIFNSIKPDWQELADYFLPRSVRFLARNVNKPIVKNKHIIDSVPLIALRNFASGMMTGATSPASTWFKLGIRNINLKDNYPVRLWCNQVERIFKDVFAASNFYQKLHEVYKQLGVFGLSVLAMRSDYDTVANFSILPIGSYRISKDNRGVVDTLCRNYMESAKNLIDMFGIENVSQTVKDAYESNNINTLFEIVHFVEPNKDFKSNSPYNYHKKFLSVYYEVAGDNNVFLNKSGFNSFPYAVFEGNSNGEDTYPSNSPGIEALPDVKQLMSLTKEYAKAVKKMVSPAYKGPVNLKGKKISDIPGAFVEENSEGRGLSPIHEVNPRVLEVYTIIEKTSQDIKDTFYNDLFAMILNTAERSRTATEVHELKEEKMVLLSPLLEQIHTALRSIMDWLLEECSDVAILPEAPEEIQGSETEIEFVSMLAQAQQAQNISSMERFTTFTSNLANSTGDPMLVKKLNTPKMIDDYAKFANINPEQVVPTEKVEAMKAQMQQQQQAQQAMEGLQQGSEIVKNMGGVDAFGSDLLARLGI